MLSDKICSLDSLAATCETYRKAGKQIAHCHGAFDLLHPGHIQHLRAARNMADVLVVTLTEDKFIRKGPGRPVYNERLRVETIASLSCVDHVATSPWPTAVETLEMIKPNLYVKGQDYRDRGADVTGAIVREEETVERFGGKLVTTDEVQFSSTKLLNRHFGVFNERQREYLSDLRERYTAGDVLATFDSMKNLKVLVIGEAIIDEYHYCLPDAMSNKTPTISARFESAEIYAGGVEAVGNHLLGLADDVQVLAGIGHDGYEVQRPADLPRAHTHTLIRDDAPTVRKRRFVHRFSNQKLFEVTFLDDRPISSEIEERFISQIDQLVPSADVVIVTDFGHGLFTPRVIQRIREQASFMAVNAQINSSNRGFNTVRKYDRPDYISVDEHEIRLPFGDRYGDLSALIRQLAEESNCDKINVTLGTEGTMYYDGNDFHTAPVFTDGVVDAIGAGDALLALTSLLVRQGAPSDLIPFAGNCMGGLMTQIVGHQRSVNSADLIKFVKTLLS
ncbi:MAG: PfkB family carbohydrate kinase [Phycisphaerae bacterium]